jgi:hypothetical protein
MDATGNGGSERQASPLALARSAREAIEELTGFTPESVSGLERNGDTWLVKVDVCELERIPSTTDVMATYVVELDPKGELLSYRRLRRFSRSEAQEER